MTRACLLYPVFVPNQWFYDRCYRSIKSILDTNTKYDLYLSGYGKEEYLNGLNHQLNIPIIRRDRNYGKGIIINELFKLTDNLHLYDHFITCDSDIVFDNFTETFDELVKIYKELGDAGVIAPNMKDSNAHLIPHQTHSKTILGHEVIWADNGEGIAGGCLVASYDAFKKAGMYRVNGIYAPDDGYIMHDMHNLGKNNYIVKDIYVTHPSGEYTKEYHDYKIDILHKSHNRVDMDRIIELSNEMEQYLK